MARLRGVRAAAAPVDLGVTTVPHVPILDVGEDWATSTGSFTFTTDDLLSAAQAQTDHALPAPVLVLGHSDPRFSGQPSLGRVVNMSVENNGQTLYGDLAGVPTWLAENMATLYPRRSIEGAWDVRTYSGNQWRFAINALALLGAVYPAIQTLADIPLLIGSEVPTLIAASAEAGLLPEPSVAAARPVTVALRRRCVPCP